MVTTEQKDFFKRREREIGQPAFFKLKRTLMQYGGDAVVPVYEDDIRDILNRGRLFEGKNIKVVPGEKSHCHANIARLHETTGCSIATGWALSIDDKLWRQHSWCIMNNKVVETTIPREKYFGFLLDDLEMEAFVRNNR